MTASQFSPLLLVGSWLYALPAVAQTPPAAPPPPLPEAPAATQPAPAQPAPTAPAAAPAPGYDAAPPGAPPAAPPEGAAPGAEPVPPGAPPAAPPEQAPPAAEGQWGAGEAWAAAPEGAADQEGAPAENGKAKAEWRRKTLKIHNSLDGSTGLVRIHEARSGAPNTFRLHFVTSYYSGSGFLCSSVSECPVLPGEADPTEDDASRSGMEFGLSVTPLPYLEAFAGLHSSATYNDHGTPKLLQALGDGNLGVKGFMPYDPDTVFTFGGEGQLWLLNGTGEVGPNLKATSGELRALATADFTNRVNGDDRLPLRVHANLGLMFNNAGQLVAKTEEKRHARITRIERFGLGIDRADFFKFGLGAEFVHDLVRPFMEWTIDVPFNQRTGYICYQDIAFTGDSCLKLNSGAGRMPSRLTLGVRLTPWLDGFSALAALDVGTGATSRFIEEVTPELPWNLYLGLGFAVDAKPEPIIKEVPIQAAPVAVPEPKRFISGVVVDSRTGEPLPNAIVRFKDKDLTGMVTNPQGLFRTGDLPPGPYTFVVTLDGFRDGECQTDLPAVAGAAAPGQPGAPGQQPVGLGQQSAPPPGVTAAGEPWVAPPGAAPGAAPGGDIQAGVKCELKALPAVGTVTGVVSDASSGQPVPSANVTITDKLGRQLELKGSPEGAFRFENVPAGVVRLTASAPGFLPAFSELDVKARGDARSQMVLSPKPKKGSVTVTPKELKLSRSIQFQSESAELLPDSMSVLQEAAAAIIDTPSIRAIEVQGHTDSGGPGYAQRLSQERAQAVVEALVKLGVDPNKLTAKGYGADKPLVPPVTAANKEKNRRIQLVITDRD
jgi:outer membrane protein OmpA-like peptidoglycan-associated protein